MTNVELLIAATASIPAILCVGAIMNKHIKTLKAEVKSLKYDNDACKRRADVLEETLKGCRAEVERSWVDSRASRRTLSTICNDLNAVRELEHKRSKLVGIKFFAKVPNVEGHVKTEFKLGIGPCGKVVTQLHLEEREDHFMLTQWCEGGERKEFKYLKSDIAGRIERAICESMPTIQPLDVDNLVRKATKEIDEERLLRNLRNRGLKY